MDRRIKLAALAGAISLTSAFSGCGKPTPSSTDAATARSAREAFNRLSSDEKRYYPVTTNDRRFVQIPGNEFEMVFHTDLHPEGTKIIVEPDLLALDNNSNRPDGHVTVVPTNAWLSDINNQLPLIAGVEMPPVIVQEGEVLNIADVGGLIKHLTDDSIIMTVNGKRIAGGGGHGIDQAQLVEAMVRSKEALGIPAYPDAAPRGP